MLEYEESKVLDVGTTLEKSNKLFKWSELTSFFFVVIFLNMCSSNFLIMCTKFHALKLLKIKLKVHPLFKLSKSLN